MTGPPRDWDKELAEIDQLIAKGPKPGPAQPPVPLKPGPVGISQPPSNSPGVPTVGRRARLGTWARIMAGVLLAVGMTQWPYAHACGAPLLAYTGASFLLVGVAIWGGISSWRTRLAAAHILAVAVALWGVGLLAAILLPRIGYAAIELAWLCP